MPCSRFDTETLEHDHVRCDVARCRSVQYVLPGTPVKNGWTALRLGLHTCSLHDATHPDSSALHMAFGVRTVDVPGAGGV